MTVELGNLMLDVELKTVSGDKKVLNNIIAINRGNDRVTKLPIVAWNGFAETIAKQYKKGDEILLQGTLQTTKRKVKDTEYEYDQTYLLVEDIKFTYGRKSKKEREILEPQIDTSFIDSGDEDNPFLVK